MNSPSRIRRRIISSVSAMCALGTLGALPAAAEQTGWPNSPVTMIIPATPGGTFDIVGRMIAKELQTLWKQPVVVEFKPGAGTIVGTNFIARSKPDGLTFGMINSAYTTNPTLRKELPYDTLNDLRGITQISSLELAIVARADAPFNNLAEFIEFAKKNPDTVSYGTPGAGSTTHLGMEMLKQAGDFDILHIPFKGSSPSHTELLGGRLTVAVDPLFVVLPLIESGRMKVIATLGQQRAPGHDFPAANETVKGFTVPALLGFVTSKDTPDERVQKLYTDIHAVITSPQLRPKLEAQGMSIVASSPSEFDSFVGNEIARWRPIIESAGIEPN